MLRSLTRQSSSARRSFRPILLRLNSRTYAQSSPSTPSDVNPSVGQSNSSKPAFRSSCLPDTVLEGLTWLKDQKPVIAKPDDEYPAWLWTLTKRREETGSKKGAVPASSLPVGSMEARKALRKANRKNIKAANFMKAA